MGVTQTQIIIAVLSGASVFFHLCSAGNFIPGARAWFIGTIFKHLHSLCNIAARLGLVSTVTLILSEHHIPDTVRAYVSSYDHQKFSLYITKFLTVSFFASIIRFFLPGPVESFSRIYKLGVILNFAATVVAAIDANSDNSGSRSLLRRKAQRRSDKSSDSSSSRSRSGPLKLGRIIGRFVKLWQGLKGNFPKKTVPLGVLDGL